MDLTRAGLEPEPEAMRELVREAGERVVSYLAGLPTGAASDFEGAAEVARSLIEAMPAQGKPYPELLDFLFDRVIPKGCNTNSPGMFSYINGGTSIHAAVADLISAATNPYISYW